MQTVKKITRAELAAILKDEKTVQGTTFVGFDALTEMKLNKTLDGKEANPHYGKVFKVLTGQVAMLFSNKTTNAYENMVNRRLTMEGKAPEFKVSARAWGTRTEGTSFVSHTNKAGEYNEYLSTIYSESPVTLADYVKDLGVELNDNDAALIDAMKKRVVGMESKSGKTEYVELVIAEDGTATFRPIAKENIQGQPPAKNEGAQGGLTEAMKVVPRDFKLESLQRLTMGGVAYLIED